MPYIRKDNQTEIPQNFWRDDLDDRPIIVTIRCITYNQENFIKDTLEGFINQKTNFRFEAIIHDDASTDGTASIIKTYSERYPSIIKPIFESKNQYSKRDGSLGRIMNAHTRGKYIAICEGDDFWIDSLKLQKQVDFLENHLDYSMVCSQFKSIINNKLTCNVLRYTSKEEISLNDLLYKDNLISTPTVLIRGSIFAKFIKIPRPSWPLGDYPIWIYAASCGKIKNFQDYFAVYRVLENSASHTNDEEKSFRFCMGLWELRIFMAKFLKKRYGLLKLKRIWTISKFVIKRFPRQNKKMIYIFNNMFS